MLVAFCTHFVKKWASAVSGLVGICVKFRGSKNMRCSRNSVVLHIAFVSSVLLLTPARTSAQNFPGDRDPNHIIIYIIDIYDQSGTLIAARYYEDESSANKGRNDFLEQVPKYKIKPPVPRSVEEERKRLKLWSQGIQQTSNSLEATEKKIEGLKEKVVAAAESLGPDADKLIKDVDRLDRQISEVKSWKLKQYQGPNFLKQGSYYYYDKNENEYTTEYRNNRLDKLESELQLIINIKGNTLLNKIRNVNKINNDIGSLERDVDKRRDKHVRIKEDHRRTAESFNEIVKAAKEKYSAP